MKRVIPFLLVAVLLVAIAAITLNNRYRKAASEYLLPPHGQKFQSLAAEDETGELRFRGIVQLGQDAANSTAILELNLVTRAEADPANNDFRLINPRLEINPVGCSQLAMEQVFCTETRYSANCHFGTGPGQAFSQTMDAGVAKVLAKSGNIAINHITSLDGTVTSINDLMSALNETTVVVDYVNVEQYFDQWYSIEFTLVSEKEGFFTVN